MLPTTQEYKISLMIGQDSFRTLEGVEVIPNPYYPEEPWYSTGGLAIVFKLKLKDKLYALKCFYTEANERQERLGLIANYLKQNPSPYFVDFTYLENELWVETENDEGQGYPVVLMEWVEGKTLDNYLEEICQQQNKPALQNLYFQFCNLAWWLQQQPIAHGDLKHDNLIVMPEGKLKLIDYDGVFVPALQGRKANEQGSPCYQHPKRDAHYFNERLDDFSLLILQITLLALQHEPSLFKAHYNGDGILLKDTDYLNFAKSPTKTLLWHLNDVKIHLLLTQLQSNLDNLSTIDLLTSLQDIKWIQWLADGQEDNILVMERQRLKNKILNDENWRDLFLRRMSLTYPLDEIMIEKYKNILNWRKLSSNSKILWTYDLLVKYEDKWVWGHLRFNSSFKLQITSELIEKYKDKWKWGEFGISSHRSAIFPLTPELIEKYKDKLDFGKWGLSGNYELLWNSDLIEKYKDKWDWEALSKNSTLPWEMSLIEKYKDKWTWDKIDYHIIFETTSCIGLVTNSGLSWTLELIETYKDRWNWKELSIKSDLPWTTDLIEKYQDKWNWEGLSSNIKLPWTLDLIERYKDKWNWKSLSSNYALPWTTDLIEKYQGNWNWEGLSSNTKLPWTIDLIEKYKDKWDWEDLSKNPSLPLTFDLIEKYQDNLNWERLSYNSDFSWGITLIEKYQDWWYWKGLSSNTKLPWTLDLIEKYKDKWNWQNLSNNSSLPWDSEMIDKYSKKWINKELRYNSDIPWTMTLIEKYQNEWDDWNKTKSINVKVLTSLLNDKFIHEIMMELHEKKRV